MPAPTNISALTATDLGTLPASVTQTVDDSGTTYTVWYKYTPPLGETEIGLWGYGDLTVYKPTTTVWTGPAAAPVQILTNISAQNKPIQIPVTAGTTVYFKFTTNAGNPTPALLTISVLTAPANDIAVGMIAVPDDNRDYPTSFLSSSVNYDVQAFRSQILSCEMGDTLDNGIVLTDDIENSTGFFLYDTLFNRTNILYTEVGAISHIRTCKGAQNFYWGDSGTSFSGIHGSIHKTSADGTLSVVAADIGAFGLTNVAATNDESLIYCSGIGNAVGTAVKTWNVAGGAFGSDLIAGIANYEVFDILVLSDDTIVIAFYRFGSGHDLIIKILNSNGTVRQIISYGTDVTNLQPRLCYAVDATSFWLFVHLSSIVGESNFINYNSTTGAVISTIRYAEYETGMYAEAATLTPAARFGNSNSCPFWIVLATSTTVPAAGLYVSVDGRWNRTPSSSAGGSGTPGPGTSGGGTGTLLGVSKTFDELFLTDSTTEDTAIPEPSATIYPVGD